MFTGWFWPALAAAFLDWTAVERGWKKVRWITKPGAMVLLIAWFSVMSGWRGPLVWFGLGLVFSLLGDVFLMLPGVYFLAGMGAFALAHVFTIIGFNQTELIPNLWVVLPLLAIAGAFIWLTGRVRDGLKTRDEAQMIVPVMAYAVILSLMFLAAVSTLFRPDWPFQAAILASLGGGLFFLSDSILAYNRFVRSLPHGDILVMTTYHLAQLCIATAALMMWR